MSSAMADELFGHVDDFARRERLRERVHGGTANGGGIARGEARPLEQLKPLTRRHFAELFPMVDGVARSLVRSPPD